ncbi:unnamed protein product [Dibothriocephalus latus]|uniref:Uncharacterized protein n=1 Tax=Dibothriocephalus latus TaxID=60516 RepID=A0A3P7LYH7_DIBLA|nr:unnamed protein product [Dibothriocephalus latus]
MLLKGENALTQWSGFRPDAAVNGPKKARVRTRRMRRTKKKRKKHASQSEPLSLSTVSAVQRRALSQRKRTPSLQLISLLVIVTHDLLI